MLRKTLLLVALVIGAVQTDSLMGQDMDSLMDSLRGTEGIDLEPDSMELKGPGLGVLKSRPTGEKATGRNLLPARPSSERIIFGETPVPEVVLRISNEYRSSIVLLGNPTYKISGEYNRNDGPLKALLSLFPSENWSVSKQGDSYIVRQYGPLLFEQLKSGESK